MEGEMEGGGRRKGGGNREGEWRERGRTEGEREERKEERGGWVMCVSANRVANLHKCCSGGKSPAV